MATWTTIPDSSLEPGKPIRSIDALALRDNPVAIAEGETGAPQIWGRAAKRLATFPALTVSAADTYRTELGSNFETLTTFTTSTENPPTVVAYRYTIAQFTGAMRFRASHVMGGGQTSRLSIYKNNVLVQAYTTTSAVPVQRTNDVSIVPGDVIEWRHSGTVAGSTTSDPQVSASDSYIDTPFYIQATTL